MLKNTYHKADVKDISFRFKNRCNVSKLNQAYKTQQLTSLMKSLVEKMNCISNISDDTQMKKTMKDFETMFNNIDVQDKMMNDIMNNIMLGLLMMLKLMN